MGEFMPLRWDAREHVRLWRQVFLWVVLVVPVGAAVGSACAFFLAALDWATGMQRGHGWLLFLLPVGGVAVAWVYGRWGKRSAGGSNLILEQIHVPGGGVPTRLAPLVLAATVVTHLLGGSAGREGTAVQMGGSIAGTAARWMRLSPTTTRMLLMAGVAAGFAGVFGTPLAGTLFALEVLALGVMRLEALIPCLIAALVADWACRAWGIGHTDYHRLMRVGAVEQWNAGLVGKTALAAVAFGLASVLFVEVTHAVEWGLKRVLKWAWLRPALGGAVVIGLVYALGTRDYLGLGVDNPGGGPSIMAAFTAAPGAMGWSWWWKILFTAVTVGSGFKGGEVTPLFFIGATLGNVLAWGLNAPVDLFAGIGFVAVFAGATNTPLACTLMAVELFGTHIGVYAATGCFLAYFFSGHSGI